MPEELESSPIAPAPEIRTHMFSPAKGKRVPGVSVLTPAKGLDGLGKGGAGGAGGVGKATGLGRGGRNDIWDSDSDDDGLPEGMSPPKTMQFYIPQSKLLKTPGTLTFPFVPTTRPPLLPPFPLFPFPFPCFSHQYSCPTCPAIFRGFGLLLGGGL